MKRRVLEALSDRGTLIEPAAADLLCRQPNALELLERYLSSCNERVPMILSASDIEEFIGNGSGDIVADVNIVTKTAEQAPRHEMISVKKDITGQSTCVGDIADFMKLFQDRFRMIKRMLMRRRELQGTIPISRARKVDKEIKFIGMIGNLRTTKKGHKILEVEDEDDSIPVLLLKGSPAFGETVVSDEVIGVIGNVAKRGEMIVANEIVRPDIPVNGGMRKSDSVSWALFAGDTHVGSDKFLENQWQGFTEWLKTAEEAKDIGYMIMPGDLVDGIGIYPDQEDELLIDDIYEQYEKFSELMKDIRDDIAIIASPGNHDAVRLAEPQPALPDSINKIFDSNITMIGNPATVAIEERNVLVYHGRSFDDWIATASGFSYERPLEIMREMLRRRHLAPIYGERTAIAPEQKDYMVIDEVPDIFVTGHIHSAGLGDYRGVMMINASTWQGQTAYQKMRNNVPDPCKAFMIHLGTGKARVVKFT